MSWLLAIGAAIGAGMGFLNTGRNRRNERESLKREQANLTAQYNYQKELSDRQYGIQRGEAMWQLAMQNRAVNEGMDQFTNQFNAHQLSRAYGEQDARIQTASGIGASLAYENMSGTRGNEANQLVRDYASQGLDRQVALQDRQDANVLAGTIQDANRARTSIEHEKAAWETGGYRHDMKEAGDLYNKQIYDLGHANYEYQLDYMDRWDTKALDYTAGIIGGASSGLGMASGMSSYNSNWGNLFKSSSNSATNAFMQDRRYI